ncbi:M12 family metallo-peptidase [Flavobacterium sp. MFBS3-15]|uniref:zinc-dependent metalloprotease n=1 Tax=Flavobacterium sp. MFBS3-15 TaxID=2989816 RepID=UPI0022368826|nr:zinc-dependent metalloprotease family protein [Flavobacterium sp. MFBS3-15]MCW4470301.1 M12 family metallo-peptidase [Flavobacterium sp. MFBS3-15]
MKKLLLSLLLIGGSALSYAQVPIWSAVPRESLATVRKVERASTPLIFHTFSINQPELENMLVNTPLRNSGQPSNVLISFPTADGKMENFRIYEAPVLHPDLGAQHPNIKSYVGRGIENPATTIRFSTTIFGVHAIIMSDKGTQYIDPYTADLQNYIVYKKSNVKAARTFHCSVNEPALDNVPPPPPTTMANDGLFRTYRLALACTIEYAAYQINAAGVGAGTLEQKKAAVLAAMTVTMTRVNGVFEKDMSLTMQIVPNNENIIFVTSDNLQNNDEGTMIDQIQPIINSGIGSANYDIGHVFGTGGGGIASLGSVCSQFKAQGVTGSPAPVGDPFDIDYVAHEMGHQFGANHTFNNSYQRTASTAVEPGSGSTIMAYAGISPPNVQSNSDDYFHAVSLNQMFNFVNGNGGCAMLEENNNTPPVIAAIPNRTIPKGTAFILKGNGTDADGDALTYCWEQTNNNGANSTVDFTPLSTSTSGPNFRSIDPSASPNRYMPELSSVLNNNLAPTWEVVPTVGRTLNFALTVRDNNTPNGGQTARQNMNVIVNNTAGPFTVTSQNTTNITWEQGSTEAITWNVAGTTGNGINTSNVNILLSTDGGLTWPTVLASNTPNDGSENITVPNVEAISCRIMVEAVGNIYYAVNQTPFSIGVEVVTECNTYTNDTAVNIPDNGQNYSISTINVPDNSIVQTVNVGVNITHTYIGDLILIIARPDNSQALLWQMACGTSNNLNVTFSDSGSSVNCGATTSGSFIPSEPLSEFEGTQAQGDWILAFADAGADDTGTLNSWFVEICSQTVNAVDGFSLKNFTLYPNPNNGSFTVGFTSESENAIQIGVHDLRGREVYNAAYENTGLFSGNVNLSNIQSGVYLVTVQDGARKAVKKIVVN